MPVVALTGLRQTGKSTVLRSDHAFAKRRYVNLDDFASLEAARRDPDALLGTDQPVTIDEVQRCPDLLLSVKRAVDRRRRPGEFLLSGSANLALLGGLSESLAGRAVYLSLLPFHRRELHPDVREKPWICRTWEARRPAEGRGKPVRPAEVLLGGMPSVCLGEVERPEVWFRGFEQTYLERDLGQLSQVGDLVAFRNLLKLVVLRTSQVLNQSDLARDAKLSVATTARWLSLLEASFLTSRLGSFLGNRASRVIRAPKLFLADSGLAAHLADVESIDPGSDEPMRGALFETWVLQNLRAILECHWPGARLSYWNVQGRYEVDFVIEGGRDCLAVEVKAASRWEGRDLSGLRAFLRDTPRCRGGLLAYNGGEIAPLGERLWAVPISLLVS